MFDKKTIIETIEKYDVGYKEITSLDSFYNVKIDDDNFEIRYNNVNFIVVTKDTVKLYFGLHYKVYKKTEEDEKEFYKDLNESLKLTEEGYEISWQ